ncbi:kinase-like protein [Obba rivulosa]|uniref:mitogen-activated protein kinase kinase n=1 Tax=Obba rivulosa TaxID=1052685 RepID=A0A8E2DT20_9APHY|nr:kinase-like protein [Obba rivulosa]
MHSLHPSPARPLGPRSIQRSVSPAPVVLPEVAPLNLRKTPKPEQSSLGPSSSLHPGLPGRTPGSSPRPKLKLPLLSFNTVGGDEGPFAGGYAGGPPPVGAAIQLNGSSSSNGGKTTVPGSGTLKPEITISPRALPPVVSMDNIRQTVEEFDQWSDDVLEELARLGEGAGGAVYKVRDRRTGAVMARKAITTLEAPMKQLLREIQITSSTSHRNIVHFYGAYISPSSSEVKVLMEYGEGGSLESVGKRMREIGGRVGERVAGRIAEGILQGLAYLHSRKTIHRDVKPPNILLTREGVVKLCDFGVSGELVNSIAGTFTGTQLYMAPERLSGLEYTIRSDVWSTGISLLEFVQNRFPFPSDLAAIELMMYITQNEPPELEDEEDIVWSPEMKDFIKATLTRDPNVRPTPRDMLDHPWITNIMQEPVRMEQFMRKVWGWRGGRKSGGSSSRPSSSRSDPSLDASMAGLSLGGAPGSDSPPRTDT